MYALEIYYSKCIYRADGCLVLYWRSLNLLISTTLCPIQMRR